MRFHEFVRAAGVESCYSKTMDLSRIILAMAEAEGPTSVLGQVVAPLLEHEEVMLARVWFLDDRDCPVCSRSREAAAAGALHLRASGARPTDVPSEGRH